MAELTVLKMKITAPTAHFRVIHSNNPRKTYPLPPYSTVIGLLANILGDKKQIDQMLAGELALGIVAKHQSISHEYTWMRNMSKKAHNSRFYSTENRNWQESLEHPGGQSPITVEVLNDVEIYIYLYHSDLTVLEQLKENAFNPEKWINHIHLGRSEDWGMIEQVDIKDIVISNSGSNFKDASSYYQWMPEPQFAYGVGHHINSLEYSSLFKKMQGTILLVTSLYKIVEVSLEGTSPWKIRNFRHIPARLCSNQIPFLDNFTLPSLYTDLSLNTPIYMGLINPVPQKGEC
ncbi:MAG: type I-B CRISPR-associated protein Cas5b [Syntrophomonadaceae bacterium]|jgi:CRISPR-associated protein Cas5t